MARSLGAIMFEMIVGYPPFYSDDPLTTCRKIVNWRMFLKFPDEIQVCVFLCVCLCVCVCVCVCARVCALRNLDIFLVP